MTSVRMESTLWDILLSTPSLFEGFLRDKRNKQTKTVPFNLALNPDQGLGNWILWYWIRSVTTIYDWVGPYQSVSQCLQPHLVLLWAGCRGHWSWSAAGWWPQIQRGLLQWQVCSWSGVLPGRDSCDMGADTERYNSGNVLVSHLAHCPKALISTPMIIIMKSYSELLNNEPAVMCK